MIKNKIYESFDEFDDDDDFEDDDIDIIKLIGKKSINDIDINDIETNRASSRSIDITKIEAIDYIKNECTNFIKLYNKYGNKICFYRGVESNDDYMYNQPSKYNRIPTSGNKGFYNYIVDNSINWKNYPKRLKSIFALPFKYKEQTIIYGSSYIVIPFDNATIAVSPNDDFWHSFSNLEKKLNLSIIQLDKIFEFFNIKFKNINDLKTELTIKNLNLKNNNKNNFLTKIIDLSIKNNTQPFDILDKLMSPNLNNFYKFTYDSNINNIKNINGEIWTESDCILIKENLLNDIIKSLNLNESNNTNNIYNAEQVGYKLKINDKIYNTINGFKNVKSNPIKFKVIIINNKIYSLDKNILLSNDNFN